MKILAGMELFAPLYSCGTVLTFVAIQENVLTCHMTMLALEKMEIMYLLNTLVKLSTVRLHS